jgi:hypothetical protein
MERRNVGKVSRHQTLLLNGKGKATLQMAIYGTCNSSLTGLELTHTCIAIKMVDTLSTYSKCTISTINHKLNVSGHTLIWTLFLGLVRGTRVQNLSLPFGYTLRAFVAKETNSVLNVARSCKEMSLFVLA